MNGQYIVVGKGTEAGQLMNGVPHIEVYACQEREHAQYLAGLYVAHLVAKRPDKGLRNKQIDGFSLDRGIGITKIVAVVEGYLPQSAVNILENG